MASEYIILGNGKQYKITTSKNELAGITRNTGQQKQNKSKHSVSRAVEETFDNGPLN